MLWFDWTQIIIALPAVLWAISFHEFCHAFAATKVGDPTPARYGRLTLSPLSHFEPLGTLMFLFAGFGWAKPVPVNTRYFRNPRRDMFLVAIAGIAGNILTAAVCILIFRFFGTQIFALTGQTGIAVLSAMINLNIVLAAFNLIPIPPLDGSKLIYSFLPFGALKYYYWLEQYGMYILLGLVITGMIRIIFSPIVAGIRNVLFFLLIP